jgi:hypothetical protein
LKLIVRSKLSGTCIGASLTLRRVTSPELIKVKNEKCDLFADSHSILARCRNRFSQPLNIHGLNDVRQTELLAAETPVPDKSDFEVVLGLEKLKGHRSPGIDQIPPEFIEAGGSTIRCVVHKFIISIWNKEKFPRSRGN